MKNKFYIFIFSVCFTLAVVFTVCFNHWGKGNIPQKVIHKQSTVIPTISETELIMNSDLIITGTVTGFHPSKFSNPEQIHGNEIPNILQTDMIIQTSEVLDGQAGDHILVRLDEGENETTIVTSDCYPDFEVGDNVLLFLLRDDSSVATDEDYYILNGMRQGVYFLEEHAITANSFDASVSEYTNQDGPTEKYTTVDLQELIQQKKNENPNWNQMQEQKRIQTQEQNAVLFGE